MLQIISIPKPYPNCLRIQNSDFLNELPSAPIPELADRKRSCKLERKGIALPRYDEAFKAGAIRMVAEQGLQPVEIAKELGICIDTLRAWLKASGIQMGQASRLNREQ